MAADKPKPKREAESEPVVVFDDEAERFGVSPITKTTAIQNAEAQASAQSKLHGQAASVAGLSTDQLQRLRTDFSDQYDSYWSRDPGRANGPYS